MLYIIKNGRVIPFYKEELYKNLEKDGFLISEYADEDKVIVNFLISRENIENKVKSNGANANVNVKRKGSIK